MKLLLAAAAVTALVVLGRAAGAHVQTFVAWVDGLGAWGPVVFVAGYVAACVAFVPGALLTIAAGVIFGLGRGVACVFAGALFISSIKTMFEKIGPCLNSKADCFMLNTVVPNTSDGIRSGVNRIREKSTEITFESNLAVRVFATPGTPSIST